MLILLQSPAEAPPLPWWVLYAVLLALTFVTYRLTQSRWWKGCLAAALGWIFVFFTAAVTLPSSRIGLIMLVAVAPAAAFIAAVAGRLKRRGPRVYAGAPRAALTRETMQGQPNPRSVLNSKLMAARFAAGMPRDVAYVARLAYVEGLQGIEARPVDLFIGGGSLWVAPLNPGSAPIPIALRDVLRVDVWPEGDAPPTLRVSWSPPAGELTRELVLGAIPEVPPPLVGRQLGAIAGAVTDAMQHDEKAALAARSQSAAPPLPPPKVELCERCGEPFADGAVRCAKCGAERAPWVARGPAGQ
jgi:hypothetical protein